MKTSTHRPLSPGLCAVTFRWLSARRRFVSVDAVTVRAVL
jgi:hypothetical protein